VVSLSLPT
jgi:hypothetical protein